MRTRLLILLGPILAAATVSAAEGKPPLTLDHVLEQMQKAHDAMGALSAKIEHERAIPLLEEKEVRRGAVYFMKPRKLLIVFDKPEKEYDLIDDTKVIVYKPALKQAEAYDLKGQGGKKVRVVGMGFMDSVVKAKEDFDFKLLGEEKLGDETFVQIQLTPKKGKERETEPYNRIVLWVDEERWMPVRIRLFESDGEVITTIRFADIKVRAKPWWGLKKKMRLKIPKNVEWVRPLE